MIKTEKYDNILSGVKFMKKINGNVRCKCAN